MEEVKQHREWMDGMEDRVNTWRERQKKQKSRRKEVTMDDLSGETDHDKVGTKEGIEV